MANVGEVLDLLVDGIGRISLLRDAGYLGCGEEIHANTKLEHTSQAKKGTPQAEKTPKDKPLIGIHSITAYSSLGSREVKLSGLAGGRRGF